MAGRNDPKDVTDAMMALPPRGPRSATPMNVQAFLAMLRDRGGYAGEFQSYGRMADPGTWRASPMALQRQQALAQALRSGRMGPGGGRSKMPVMPL